MAKAMVAPEAVWDEKFVLPPGVSRQDALRFANTASAIHDELMSSIILDDQNAGDIAWAARFIMGCAQTCYLAAAGVSRG